MAASKGHGVSKPISLAEPTDLEQSQSERLVDVLQQLNLFETAEGMKKREDVIDCLKDIVGQWVSSIAVKQAHYRDLHGSKVVAFGGHVLGVVMKESDLDLVCIVPDYVSREEFFTSFVTYLAGIEVTQLRLVAGARVPIITMCLKGYQIDLCIAQLANSYIPEPLGLSQDEILENMDITDIRSLNGTRETSKILDLVPNVDNFRTVLKAVKLWAKAKGLHDCPMGYPGGIAWAIMVARVCQLYPYATATTILNKFYVLFKDWRWPSPVLIAPLTKRDVYKLNPWNPKLSHADTHHVMPVITPAYPEKNCAFTVTKSALQILTQQMNLAVETMERITREQVSWAELFQPIEFFKLYKHFLMMTARASSPQDHLDWSGLVRARARVLVEDLEKQTALSLVHAYPKPYVDGNETKWFWGLQFTVTKGVKLSLAEDLHKFNKHLIEKATERHLYKPGMMIDVKHIRRKDLATVLPEPKEMPMEPQ